MGVCRAPIENMENCMFGIFGGISIEHVLKRDFPNGSAIFLPQEAPVKSEFYIEVASTSNFMFLDFF